LAFCCYGQDSLVIDISDGKRANKKIAKSITRFREIKVLTIINFNGWSGISYIGDEVKLFKEESPEINKLPAAILKLSKLEALNLRALGLQTLPTGMDKLSHLEVLDISFNKLDLEKEVAVLSAITNLKVLKIYGMRTTLDMLSKLLKINPDLKVLHTSQHLKEEYAGQRR
jgi:hypothetical protein